MARHELFCHGGLDVFRTNAVCFVEPTTVFLHCCPYCPSYPANVIQMGHATWAIWPAIKEYSLSWTFIRLKIQLSYAQQSKRYVCNLHDMGNEKVNRRKNILTYCNQAEKLAEVKSMSEATFFRFFVQIYCKMTDCSPKISEVNLSVFIYRLFHDDFSSIVETNTALRFDLIGIWTHNVVPSYFLLWCPSPLDYITSAVSVHDQTRTCQMNYTFIILKLN